MSAEFRESAEFSHACPLHQQRNLPAHQRKNIHLICAQRNVLRLRVRALRKDKHARLMRNECAMLRWICQVKVEEQVITAELYERLNICHLKNTLRYNRLRWGGHVHRSVS